MSQIPMGFGPLERARAFLAELMRDLDAACEAQRKKTVAAELDLAPSTLSNILAGRKSCSAELLLALLDLDDGDHALKRMAARRGYALRRLATPEEQLERLREVMRRRVGNVADEIEREALGEDG